jgi:hypothetical protein
VPLLQVTAPTILPGITTASTIITTVTVTPAAAIARFGSAA